MTHTHSLLFGLSYHVGNCNKTNANPIEEAQNGEGPELMNTQFSIAEYKLLIKLIKKD